MSRHRRPRVIFEGFSEGQNAEMRCGEADGEVWAREMVKERDSETLLMPLNILGDLPVIRIEFYTRFLLWLLVLRPAINEYQEKFGDDESRETYRQGVLMERPDYVRGFYQGALGVLRQKMVGKSTQGGYGATEANNRPKAAAEPTMPDAQRTV